MGSIIPYIKQPTRVFNTAQVKMGLVELGLFPFPVVANEGLTIIKGSPVADQNVENVILVETSQEGGQRMTFILLEMFPLFDGILQQNG